MFTLTGWFKNLKNETIQVTIKNKDYSGTVTYNINDATQQTINNVAAKIEFSGEPVIIERTQDDLFTPIIKHSATISFVTDTYLGDYLFAANAHSVNVKIKNTTTNEYLFYGFVEPNTFSQPYAQGLDELSINCIDALSTFKYRPFGDIKSSEAYDIAKGTADNMSFRQVINVMFGSHTMWNELEDDHLYFQYYTVNGNKSTIYTSEGNTFNSPDIYLNILKLSTLPIFGDEYDDLKTMEEVLEDMLRYLNMYIIQQGEDFYIFYQQSPTSSTEKTFLEVWSDTSVTKNINTINVTTNDYMDDSTNISIDDVYNQIVVNCELVDQEAIVESPLDSDYLSSNYPGKQLYMTEYISEGSGDTARDSMEDIITGRPSTYAKKIDWYIQPMRSSNWRLYYYNGTSRVNLDELTQIPGLSSNQYILVGGGKDHTEASGCLLSYGEYVNPWAYGWLLKDKPLVPFICKLGSVEKSSSATDNSPTSKIDMNNYLYISINGNENDTENGQGPSETDIYNATHDSNGNAVGLLEFVGNSTGATLSPPDKDTTNYLVFSGRLLLQPIVYESSSNYATRNNSFADMYANGCHKSEGSTARVPYYDGSTPPVWPFVNNLVKSDNNGEGRYYSRKCYCGFRPSDGERFWLNTTHGVMQPWTKDKSARGYQFNYSAAGDGSDTIKKLPVLECSLTIGNKRLVENAIDSNGNSQFGWYTIGQEPYWRDGEGHYITDDSGNYIRKTTFSLGVNPKIGDYIIGDEFPLQNTISFDMNIDAEGTAIPITYNDRVSGAVDFRILGPINLIWNQITRRHPTFFRHTKWYDNYHYILSHVENIIIKEFECKVYTNNGQYENTEKNDLIYMSDEQERYVKKKDDIKFNIITQPTTEECVRMGISTGVYMNSVIINGGAYANLPAYKIRISKPGLGVVKPEEAYINELYNSYKSPHIILNTKLRYNSGHRNWDDEYAFTYIGNGSMQILNSTYNVRENSIELTLREH